MKQNKAKLRNQLKLARSKLSSADVEIMSSKITEQLKKATDWDKVQSVHMYLPIESNKEVDTWRLLRWIWSQHPALETSTSIYSDSRSMRHVIINENTKFKNDLLGIPMPVAGYELRDMDYDVVIVPVLGFDNRMNRLGYGEGVYDSFLSKYPNAQKIGLAYEISRLESIPTETHDMTLDEIVTEDNQIFL